MSKAALKLFQDRLERKKEPDEADILGASIAKRWRALPKIEQIEVRGSIEQVFKEFIEDYVVYFISFAF